jgi:YhcH/YjgK/YiaL family protein
MIIDLIENMKAYTKDIPSLKKVIAIIESGALKNIKPGQYTTDDKKVRYNVFGYETKETSAATFEVHRMESDVQILLSGKEKMDCAWPAPTETVIPYDEKKDASFVKGKVAFNLHAVPGTFVVFVPGEPHAPSLVDEQPSQVLKVVFKLHV